jgi:integral membrane sensor domain MASE1
MLIFVFVFLFIHLVVSRLSMLVVMSHVCVVFEFPVMSCSVFVCLCHYLFTTMTTTAQTSQRSKQTNTQSNMRTMCVDVDREEGGGMLELDELCLFVCFV